MGLQIPSYINEYDKNGNRIIMVKDLSKDIIYKLVSEGKLLPRYLGCYSIDKNIAYKILYFNSGIEHQILYFSNNLSGIIDEKQLIYTKQLRNILFTNMYNYNFDSEINQLDYIMVEEPHNIYGTKTEYIKIDLTFFKIIDYHILKSNNNNDLCDKILYNNNILICPILLKDQLIPEYIVEFFLPRFTITWNEIKHNYSNEYQEHIDKKITQLNELNKEFNV